MSLISYSMYFSPKSDLCQEKKIEKNCTAQNISSNLHLLADRMDNMAQKPEWADTEMSETAKQELIDQSKERVEFVWIAAYDTAGAKLYGDSEAPSSITGKDYYAYLTATQNLTIGSPEYRDGLWQLSVGIPVLNADGGVPQSRSAMSIRRQTSLRRFPII